MNNNLDSRRNFEEKNRREKDEQQEKKLKKEKIKSLEKKIKLSEIRFDLEKLKELVANSVVSPKIIEDIMEGKNLQDPEVIEIFEKIDEVETLQNIDKLLPPDLRITKEEYILALQDDQTRQQIINKIDNAIDYMFSVNNGEGFLGLKMFSVFFMILNKNLKTVQENYIDIKHDLQNKN